jgi:hypothetical protein
MTMKKGSIGVPLRIATGFDMSGSTSLTMILTKPDGTQLTKTSGAGEVSAPAVALTNDPDLGNVAASTYFEYTNAVDDYDVVGDIADANAWTVCGIYNDATPKVYPTAPVPFTVLEGCA